MGLCPLKMSFLPPPSKHIKTLKRKSLDYPIIPQEIPSKHVNCSIVFSGKKNIIVFPRKPGIFHRNISMLPKKTNHFFPRKPPFSPGRKKKTKKIANFPQWLCNKTTIFPRKPTLFVDLSTACARCARSKSSGVGVKTSRSSASMTSRSRARGTCPVPWGPMVAW